MVDGIVMCPWYLAALPLYFFYMFVKRNNYLTERHIDEYPKSMIYSPVLSFTEKMLKSNIRIIDILSYLIKYLQSCLRAIQVPLKIKPEQNIWKQIYGYWISTKMHSLIYMCIIHFAYLPLIQSMKNLILAILYLMAVILQRNWDLKYEKLQKRST